MAGSGKRSSGSKAATRAAATRKTGPKPAQLRKGAVLTTPAEVSAMVPAGGQTVRLEAPTGEQWYLRKGEGGQLESRNVGGWYNAVSAKQLEFMTGAWNAGKMLRRR